MRINENQNKEYSIYSDALKKNVRDTFYEARQIAEIKALLHSIKEEAIKLEQFFLTKDELKERNDLVDFFDSRMHTMVFYTKKNMEKYRLIGWQELIDNGEDQNDAIK